MDVILDNFINRDEFINEYCLDCGQGCEIPYCACPTVESLINAPLVTLPTQKTAMWIETGLKNVYGGKQIKCSDCGFTVIVSPEHFSDLEYYEAYCCHCGAKMMCLIPASK